MWKLKTSELEGAALDWAVAQARIDGAFEYSATPGWSPSTVWSQGGPIIEQEQIDIQCYPRRNGGHIWRTCYSDGPTPLIAAMRCYVASKLGETVEVPEDIALDSLVYETGDE